MPLGHRATRILLALAACAIPAVAVPASAAVSAPGVNIRWDNCFADGGVWNKLFACDTNTGSESLVLSYALDTQMTNVSGNEIIVDFSSPNSTLPAWWSFKNVGTCRQTSLSLTLTPPAGMAQCLEWAPSALQAGGIGAFATGFFGPGWGRITAATAVPQPDLATIEPDNEYFLASLVINHAKTVGTGACTGCDVPVCIVFQRLRVDTPTAANDRTLSHGANFQGSQIAYWQNGYASNVSVNCNQFGGNCETTFTCVPYSATQARGSTWGQVKSLYR